MQKLSLMTSWDDGSELDLKMAGLLYKYKLPGIFYIPTCSELENVDIKVLDGMGFFIGGHTTSHPSDIKILSKREMEYEIIANKLFLQAIIQKDVDTFCYPRGRYNDQVIEVVKAARFKSARTTAIGSIDVPENVFTMPTTAHVYNRGEYNGVKWQEYARQKFLEAKAKAEKGETAIYHLWGHSEEIERFGWWEELEDLFKFINENLSAK